MVQAKPVEPKALKKTKPIIPVALMLLDEKKKTKKSVTKLGDPFNYCIMKTNKTENGLKKKDENTKTVASNPAKFKPKKEKPEKIKVKLDKPSTGVNKFSKKDSNQNSNPANVGKNKTKTDGCLPVAKVPKTKKLIQPQKKTAESKNNNKDPSCDVHNIVNKKPEPKKPSQSKKQSKNTSVDVNKKPKTVNKNSTKGNNANVSKVVIVKKLEKPLKSNSKNMAVSKILNLNEAKPKAAPPKKKVNKTPKKIESDKTEQNNNVDSAKPKIKRKPKAETEKVLKKLKKEKEENKKTEKAKVKPDKIKDENNLALVPVNVKPQGRGRKKSTPDLEPNANNQMILHTGRKVIERKKKVVLTTPKKQRVASLNALAKVHCLYENDINCIKTTSTSINNSETAIIVSRSHRSTPGLRSIGHHWEMSDSSSTSSSSSDDSSDHEMIEERKKETPELVTPEPNPDEEPKPKAKRRKRATEIKMDLKDMVVRKRMASLNASAILAASYSSEKRSTVIVKTQEETKKKQAKEKEELVMGKRKSKKNKLSVIVEHQDTDVTITVNRSTRSTHERVCSINGMHYCISSTTSHTQTEATTVATEAVLHADNQPPPLPQLTDSSSPCTSYTPLTALSSMTPPGAVTHEPQRSPYTSSAFTPPGHYRQHDYYQPAGPLISQPPPPPAPSKSHPTEPIYPPAPPMYPSYHPPYESSLHSSYPSYYSPQPVYSQRYYPNPKELAPPSQYYPSYGAPPSQHSYYQPSPPSLYLYPPAPPPSYPPQSNAPPSSCYSHPSTVNPRLGPMDSSHQNCPCPLQSCPMQSCPKNGHVGPLTGSAGKGFPKPAAQQAPLPLLALSLELPGNLGPPSPARGSTGMPPPPSPALVTARNPDNGLLTTSKLISESMQVTNDDKMKLGVAKCENGGDSLVSDLAELKQSRKRKQPPIMDRVSLKKVAQECHNSHNLKECHNTHSLKLNNGEVKQIVETRLPSGLDDLKSTSQLPPTLSTSQLLLKPAVPQELERTVTKHNHVMPQQVYRTSEIILHKKKNGLKKKSLELEDNKQGSICLSKQAPTCLSKQAPTGLSKQAPTCLSKEAPICLSKQATTFLNKEVPVCLNGAIDNKCHVMSDQKKQKRNSSPSSKPHLQLMRKQLKPTTPDLSKLSPNSLAIKNLKWSNGWSWEGTPYEASVFLSGDEQHVVRNCYPAMRHIEGDIIQPRDCILLKSGTRKKDLPFIAKVGALWENPEDGEMMVSLLWYYRPEHTEQGTIYQDNKDEIFASRHRDINSVACIEDKCYVLTYREYCRYRKKMRSIEDNVSNFKIIVPPLQEGQYERQYRQPPGQVSPDRVFYCHKVYDFRTKRLLKNPC